MSSLFIYVSLKYITSGGYTTPEAFDNIGPPFSVFELLFIAAELRSGLCLWGDKLKGELTYTTVAASEYNVHSVSGGSSV